MCTLSNGLWRLVSACSVISVELYYIFATLWGREQYTLFGILFILVSACSAISVELCYIFATLWGREQYTLFGILFILVSACSAISVELYYIFATLWGREQYTLFGILFILNCLCLQRYIGRTVLHFCHAVGKGAVHPVWHPLHCLRHPAERHGLHLSGLDLLPAVGGGLPLVVEVHIQRWVGAVCAICIGLVS